MRDSQLRYGPSRIDVTKIQPVEMPTLTASRAVGTCSALCRRGADINCINRNRAGEREGS